MPICKHVFDRTKDLLNFLYENWFLDVDGLTKSKWEKLIEKYGLFNFEYSALLQKEQEDLENELKKLDVTNERNEIQKQTFVRKNPRYHEEQILEYFDKETINIGYNSKKVWYTDNVFTFVVDKDADNPKCFRCGVKEDDDYVLITYNYDENKFSVENISKEPHLLYKKENILSDNINHFIRSFNRYLRKQWNKEPLWVEHVETEI